MYKGILLSPYIDLTSKVPTQAMIFRVFKKGVEEIKRKEIIPIQPG